MIQSPWPFHVDDSELKHWERPKTAVDEKNPWTSNPKPIAVETTAYALLAYTHRNLIGNQIKGETRKRSSLALWLKCVPTLDLYVLADSLPLVRWLLSQRNEEGGFISTQDTVMGLTALAKFATAIRSGTPDINIQVTHPGGTNSLKLSPDNAIVLEEIRVRRNWI